MESNFTSRAKERYLDFCDWADFRPDPHWWPFLAIPAAIGAAYLMLPESLLKVLLLATGVAFAWCLQGLVVAMAAWILLSAALDVARSWYARHAPQAQETGWANRLA